MIRESVKSPNPLDPIESNGWNDVNREDRVPPNNKWLLVVGYSRRGGIYTGMGVKVDDWGWTTVPDRITVTHWMELPEAPGSKNVNDSAFFDWAGSDPDKVHGVARYMLRGYSIREAFSEGVNSAKSDAEG